VSQKVALCLPGGGATGALFQIGALAALEDALEGLEVSRFDLYVGSSGGASVAAALAGGVPVQRIYRAFLDPADAYFGLERRHLLRVDFGEWKRALPALISAVSEGASGLMQRGSLPPPAALWEKLDRLAEALPGGLFTLEGYERFLEEFFVRRGVPNTFFAMPRALRILAHDLESGDLVEFGAAAAATAPVTRACIASMAISPFFSPVRVGERWYINPGAGQIVHVDVAIADGADVIVIVNPLVPLNVAAEPGERPLRERGLLAVINQSIRVGAARALGDQCRRAEAQNKAVLLVEPEPAEGVIMLGNPSSFDVRRRILESAYRHVRAVLGRAAESRHDALARAGWALRPPRSEPRSEMPE
jgi:predicted acylesterase/phospholipase RssA